MNPVIFWFLKQTNKYLYTNTKYNKRVEKMSHKCDINDK